MLVASQPMNKKCLFNRLPYISETSRSLSRVPHALSCQLAYVIEVLLTLLLIGRVKKHLSEGYDLFAKVEALLCRRDADFEGLGIFVDWTLDGFEKAVRAMNSKSQSCAFLEGHEFMRTFLAHTMVEAA